MQTVELFCGTKSFSKVMSEHGHATFTVDNETYNTPDLAADVNYLDANKIPYKAELFWASPPCTAFSVASIGTHWGGGKGAYIAKTDKARIAQDTVLNTFALIMKSNPKWYFVENPRGVLRKMSFMQGFHRVTVSYCQYGDTRMKPTDIWTNATWWKPRPICKNGDMCHERAPRGAKTGTQGINGARDRGRIPPELFEEILEQMPH